MIGHPAIPHTHSFMEIYGVSPEWAAHCSKWYAQAGFDVIIMKQTIPGHVFNSFLRINMQHGLKLVNDGVCSPQDVNTTMRHFGRDLYGRQAYLALLCMVGGDRGLQGGLELSSRIRDDAIFLTLFSSMKRQGYTDFVARTTSKYLGRFLAKLSPPFPAEWLDECKIYEDKITKGGTVPVQTGCFQVTSEMYSLIPLEPNNDPLKLPE